MTTSVPSKRAPRLRLLPTSTFGWWAIGCAVFGIALTVSWQFMPLGAWPGFIVQIAGGVLALVAIMREKDRPVTVVGALLPMLFVIWFIAGEMLSLAGVLPEH